MESIALAVIGWSFLVYDTCCCFISASEIGRIILDFGRIMTKLDRKAVIKECLKSSLGNLSTAELISKLGEEFKERTVRRLAELVNEGAIKQSGQGRSTRYQYHTQNPSERSAPSFVFSALSQQSIEHVKKPLFDRPPVGYQQSFRMITSQIRPLILARYSLSKWKRRASAIISQ